MMILLIEFSFWNIGDKIESSNVDEVVFRSSLKMKKVGHFEPWHHSLYGVAHKSHMGR